jgi:hypothetical protein
MAKTLRPDDEQRKARVARVEQQIAEAFPNLRVWGSRESGD